jgi:hypothetical protein
MERLYSQCELCNRKRRSRFIKHHLKYRPEITIEICEFCHWVIHRPGEVQILIDRIKQRYVALYGQLPIKSEQREYT